MPSFTSLAIAGFLLLGTSSLVAATPAPDRVQVRQDGVADFPVAATLVAQMLPEVDPTFKADLEANVVINLDQPLAKSKSRRSRRDWYGPWDDEPAAEEARDTAGASARRERRESQLDGDGGGPYNPTPRALGRSRRDWYGPWDDEPAAEEARDTAGASARRERRESQLDGDGGGPYNPTPRALGRSRRDWYGPWDDEPAAEDAPSQRAVEARDMATRDEFGPFDEAGPLGEEARDTATSRGRRDAEQLDGDGGGPYNPHGSKRAPQSGGGADPIHPSVDGRQAATGSVCNIEGYAIVDQQLTPFQGTVENAAENHGRIINIVNVVPDCVMSVVPQADCKFWAITAAGGCGTASLTSFS